MSTLARIAAISLSVLTLGAAPAPTLISYPKAKGEFLIVPDTSPVRFQGWREHGSTAHFGGRFVLSGTFILQCSGLCNEDDNVELYIVPDRALLARLPHWKLHKNDMMIAVMRPSQVAKKITTSIQRTRLASGKLPDIRGRISIVAEDFTTQMICDSADYYVRFIAVSKPAKIVPVRFSGNYGCGAPETESAALTFDSHRL